MIHCNRCDYENEDTSAHCVRCGTQLDSGLSGLQRHAELLSH